VLSNRRSQVFLVAVGVVLVAGLVISRLSASPDSGATAPPSATVFGSVVPGHPSDPDSARVELGTQFKAAVNGAVSGVRFYKGTGNTGTHIGRLYGPTGTLLKSVTFAGESASGWQQASFSSPVAVDAGVTYTVAYVAPNGRYAGDSYYPFPKVSGDLTALAGVYKYGGGYPTSVSRSSNYYVDVAFTPTSSSLAATKTTPLTTVPAMPGWFSFGSLGQIIDPDGKEFVPVGVNASGPDWVWNDPTIGQSAIMDMWRFNTLRVNACFQGGCPNSDGTPAAYDFHTNDDLDGIVSEYTAKKDVIVIANMQWGAGGNWADHIPELTAWWKTTAARYKDNPYVWFNLENEPTTSAVTDNPQVLTDWANLHTQISQAIRAVAPHNIIVLDGNDWGQEKGTWSCDPLAPAGPGQGYPYVNSAIVNMGPQVQANVGPVLFSLHVYGTWGGGEAQGCTPELWDATFNAYVAKVRSLGLPLVIGEAGANAVKADERWSEGGSWNAVHMLARVLPAAPVKTGVLFWHGSAGSGFSLFSPQENWTEYPRVSASLNWEGQFMFDYAHKVNP